MVAGLCLWGTLKAWQVGASRLLTHHAKAARLLAQTELAVNKTPYDPEAYSGRAYVLLNSGRLSDALPAYERAAALRPRDYFLWLELGRARDMNNDEQGALAALEQAVNLAPAYAEPRWQFGNVLFRLGRTEEAFREMRSAALSDPALLPNLIDLAWGANDGDPAIVEQIIRPERASWRIALAKYFIKRERISEALAQFRLAGGISEEDRRALLNELLAAKRYREAYELWSANSGDRQLESGLIVDGGFENQISRASTGFGWQLTRDTQSLRVSLDSKNPHTGAQSLRIDFNGDSNPGQQLLKQLVLVEPSTRYRLRLAVRMEEIVTGGLPLVGLMDASGKEGVLLAQSAPFKLGSGDWHEYTIDLTTTKTTSAMLISLHRQHCSSGPCPIFGRLWVDDFSLEKLSAGQN
jgi:tetratricopeptide (TPR) repeat protein